MRKMICVLLCLFLPALAVAEAPTGYLGDGVGMSTVTAETSCYRQPREGTVLTLLPEGARVIATGETVIASGNWQTWSRVYVPGHGYGYVEDRCLQQDEPRRIAYQPGFGVSAALFTVADANQVYVGIASLDGLEFPVITVQRIYSQQQEDGSYVMAAAFNSASDVCKTTRESLCATLYNLDGQPLEVLTLVFDAPTWR